MNSSVSSCLQAGCVVNLREISCFSVEIFYSNQLHYLPHICTLQSFCIDASTKLENG